MFTLNVQADLDHLWDLQQRNETLQRHITAGEGLAIDRLVSRLALSLSRLTSLHSPRVTGTLSMAHRGEAREGEGRVYLERGLVNPVGGGDPAVYGPLVHQRKPWWEQVIMQSWPGLLHAEMQALTDTFEALYQQ